MATMLCRRCPGWTAGYRFATRALIGAWMKTEGEALAAALASGQARLEGQIIRLHSFVSIEEGESRMLG